MSSMLEGLTSSGARMLAVGMRRNGQNNEKEEHHVQSWWPCLSVSSSSKIRRQFQVVAQVVWPFDVMEVHWNAYHLYLLDSIHIYLIVNVSFLKLYVSPTSTNPLHQVRAPIVWEDTYKVDYICDHCYKGCQWQVYIKWVGYLVEQSTWKPINHL